MSDLMKSGATMLQAQCPECNSPLFMVKGEVWCPRCNKRVITIKEGEEPLIAASALLDDVEKTILFKIQEINQQILEEKDLVKLEKLSILLMKWLEALERTRRIKKL